MLPFALGLSLALSVGFALTFHGFPVALPPIPFLEAPAEAPVLVIVVGTASRVRRVHAAIDRRDLVIDTPGAFALGERAGTPRRIVAANYDAVGPLLGDAGWADAKLEIVTPRLRRDGDTRHQPARSGGSEALDLGALAAKPTLTLSEAVALLNSGAL